MTTATGATTGTRAPQPSPTMIGSTSLDRADFSDPAGSLYILSYLVGEKYAVDQSYCTFGRSHANQLAYDFSMDLGDYVSAARSGQGVEAVENYSDDDANSSHFNYVFILHEDGTAAFYAHLMQNSILVEVGNAIEAGQVIARVGHSGMVRSMRQRVMASALRTDATVSTLLVPGSGAPTGGARKPWCAPRTSQSGRSARRC